MCLFLHQHIMLYDFLNFAKTQLIYCFPLLLCLRVHTRICTHLDSELHISRNCKYPEQISERNLAVNC